MLKGFKEFILRGNVIELATAVIVGAAFTAIVTAFTDGIIKPLIASVPGSDAGKGLGFFIKKNGGVGDPATFLDFGTLITATINFIIVAAVVYFIIVVPYNKLSTLGRRKDEVPEDTEISLLAEIRDLLESRDGAEKSGAEAKTLVTPVPIPQPAPEATQRFSAPPPADPLASGPIPKVSSPGSQSGPSYPSGPGAPTPPPAPGSYPPPGNYPPSGGFPAPGSYPPPGNYPPPGQQFGDPDSGRHSR
ncbi:MAG: large conductance mechanosensitive channel protein MscL [Gordonia sp. (in: high G+C Gram-positive bacteria)]